MDGKREIHTIEQINGKYGQKYGYKKIVMSDGKKYLLKRVYIPSIRIDEFMEIKNAVISQFQKIVYIGKTSNRNEYWILLEWAEEHCTLSDISGMSDVRKREVIKKAAESLKKLHEDERQKKKVFLTKNDVASIIDQKFLSQRNKELLFSYMITKLPLINSRYKTVVHGDMHTGNVLITKNEEILFIDLDDVQYGDPFIDLVYASNLIFSEKEYPIYYLFLKYYFENNIPQDFWPIVNFYSICKAVKIMKAEIDNSVDGKPVFSMDSFICEHAGLRREEPYWYQEIRRKDHG